MDFRKFCDLLVIVATLFLASPAISQDRQDLDWGDLAAAQELLRQEGYRGLTVIGVSVRPQGDRAALWRLQVGEAAGHPGTNQSFQASAIRRA